MPTEYVYNGRVRSAWGRGATFGRGPTGRIRNMGAMTDEKLLAVEDVLRNVGSQRDDEAMLKAQSVLRSRGFQFVGNGWTTGGGVKVTRAQYVSAVAPSLRREDYEDEDEWLLAALAAG